jgi:O-antigen/teichoic acid export membrane protein
LTNSYLKRLLDFFNKTSIKNIGYLTIGQGISQAISLIGVLYIPKLLGPEGYGHYQTVLSYVSVFTVFSLTGLNKVVLRNGSREVSKLSNEIESIIGIRHLFTFFAALIAVLAAFYLNYDSEIILYISIYVFWLWIRTIESTINLIFQAHQELIYFSVFGVVKSILLSSSLIAVLLLGGGIVELLIIDLLISAIVIFLSYNKSRNFTSFNFFSPVKLDLKILKEGLVFSLLSFFNVLGSKIDVVMISLLGTPLEVGIYALANSVVRRGLLASRAISTSIFPLYAKQAVTSMNRAVLHKHSLLSLIPSSLVVIVVFIGSSWFINNIIGVDFAYSADIMKVLSFYLLFHYMCLPYDIALQATYSEKALVKIRAGLAILNIGANYVFYEMFGIMGIAISSILVKGSNLVLVLIKTRLSIPYKNSK